MEGSVRKEEKMPYDMKLSSRINQEISRNFVCS